MKDFFNWLIFKNPISLVYYAFFTTFFVVTFYQEQSIIDNNNELVFYGILFFLSVCTTMFTVFSVIPEYKRRNE